ncbi:hypothetical protein [Flavobacterium sp.]|uniref:hypothetical protein n=1 Tax=Flavobacterium sp. TaxID=239 RepID=UPI00260A73B2|nr:hypothetical protein [Flavobacterium sp.]
MSGKKVLKYVGIGFAGLIVISAIMTAGGDEAEAAPATETPAVETPAAANAPVVPASKWNYSDEKDKMSGETKYFAFIDADQLLNFEFPYDGGSTASLQIRNEEKSTDVMFLISKGQIVTGNAIDGGTTRVKFDDEKPMMVNVSYPSDHSTDVIFLSPTKKIVDKMKTAKKFLIEVEFYDEGIRQIEFDVDKLEWNH